MTHRDGLNAADHFQRQARPLAFPPGSVGNGPAIKVCVQHHLQPRDCCSPLHISPSSFQNIPDSALLPNSYHHQPQGKGVLALSGPLVATRGTNMEARPKEPSIPASLKTLALTPRK